MASLRAFCLPPENILVLNPGCLAPGEAAADALAELGTPRCPGGTGWGAWGRLRNQRIPNPLSGRSSGATRSPVPLAAPGQDGSRGSPGDPSRHGQLPPSSPRRAARPRQRCQPAFTSSINSLHTVHIDRFCSLPGFSPSLACPPPRRLLHRWAARPACCMIHTNSLTQGNQWARKSTRSKARSLSGDRPPNKETQRAAACAPPLPTCARRPAGQPRDPRPPPWPPMLPPPAAAPPWPRLLWDGVRVFGSRVVQPSRGVPPFSDKAGGLGGSVSPWGVAGGLAGGGQSPTGHPIPPPKPKRKHIPLLCFISRILPLVLSSFRKVTLHPCLSFPTFNSRIPLFRLVLGLCQAALVHGQDC